MAKLEQLEVRTVFALAIVNEKFDDCDLDNRDGAEADRENIKESCKNAKFTLNDLSNLNLNDTNCKVQDLKTDDLTAEEMGDLFKNISKGDFSSYDAFICFISSHGVSGGIQGVDGNIITVKKIVRYLKKCPTLVGKPKLFFTQNCRGEMRDAGVTKPKGKDKADHEYLFTIPIEADILVAYSSVDGYESYRHVEKGSWFITALTKVLNEHVHSKQLTDMLAIVSNLVADKVYKDGWKQMPCFTSTLRKAVVFKTSEPVESEEPQ